MGILNQPSDGLFNVLIAIVRCLVATGPVKKDKLLGVCAPASLTDQKMARTTLRRWTQIGLFVEVDDEIRFSDELPVKLSKRNFSLEELAHVIRSLVYEPRNNERFWEREDNQSADMCRLTSWMLAQDIHSIRPSNFQEADDLYVKQVNMPGVERQFTNSTRWNGFTSWATFLGFGQFESGRATGEFIVDPTSTITRHVIYLLSEQKVYSITEFLKELAQLVPVIDGGRYREEVESKLNPANWKKPSDNEISTSLSRALLRLQSQGAIRLEKRSDSDAQLRLIGRGQRVVQSVTHVQRGVSK